MRAERTQSEDLECQSHPNHSHIENNHSWDEEFNRDELRRIIADSPEGTGRIRIIQHKNRTTTPPVVHIDDEFLGRVDSIRGVKSTEMA